MRSMHRMMQSAGTAEGLRGLIDMSLLRSVKKIISNRGLFGPSILPIGMSVPPGYTYLQLLTSLTSDKHYGDLCPQRANFVGYNPGSGAPGNILPRN